MQSPGGGGGEGRLGLWMARLSGFVRRGLEHLRKQVQLSGCQGLSLPLPHTPPAREEKENSGPVLVPARAKSPPQVLPEF